VRDVREGPENSKFIYDKSATIDGPGDAKCLTDAEGFLILERCETFNWEQKSAGMLLAGWMFLAAICGALDWRPHIWLTAAAGSGKSTVLSRLLLVMLGNFALVPVGVSTEAGIRQKLSSAARPVIFDEAECNEDDDKSRVRRILDLARVSSSRGQGEVLKGTIGGTGMNFAVRSMFLFCSIATALKQNADKTRFTVLTLKRATEVCETPEAARLQWRATEAQLAQIATPEAGRRMIARACSMILVVRESTQVFADACAIHLGTQRLGDQYGTLCAGAWALTHPHVPTLDEATAWLDLYPLSGYVEESNSETDEKTLAGTLVQYQARVDIQGSGSQTRTVKELIGLIVGTLGGPTEPVSPEAARKALGRLGMKVEGGQADKGVLYLANTSRAIKQQILRNTPWTECWPQTLLRVHGAMRAGVHHFPEIGSSRAVSIGLDALEDA
jgi:putative DNA primase/helicase